MPSYHRVIGIDLGTTFSVVSVFDDERGRPVALDAPGRMPPTCIVPSVVSVSRQGKLLVGWQAKRNIGANPENTVIEVKRDMGKDKKFMLGGREFTPPMISAMVLRELKTIAEQKIGGTIYDAVITVPAHFTFVQRQATEEAAKIAELNPRLLINEPTAAAIAYRGLYQDGHAQEEDIYIVYDLGGGTFDVSVVSIQGESVEVMGTAGNDRIGGGDFDNAIVSWAFQECNLKHLKDRPDVLARVKAAAETAKIELSGSETAVIEVPNLPLNAEMYCELDRETFVNLLQQKRPRPRKEPIGMLEETLTAVEEAVASARNNFKDKRGRDFSLEDIAAFLMVGGSTRIPKVRELLKERFGKDVIFDPDIVDQAVSLGAAIQARRINPMDSFGEKAKVSIPTLVNKTELPPTPPPVDLVDVTGHSLGVAVGRYGEFLPLIRKDTDLPMSVTKRDFTTTEDNQGTVRVEVYQGEDPIAANNTPVGVLLFEKLESHPMGHYLFDVTFKLDKSGLLKLIVTKRVKDNSHAPEVQTAEFNAGAGVPMSREDLEKRRAQLQALFASGGLDPQAGVQPSDTPPAAAHQAAAGASATATTQPPVQPPLAPSPVSTRSSEEGDMEALIPVDYRDIWKKAKDRAATLPPVRKITLQTAIRHFEAAVKTGEAGAIEEYGAAMIETYFSNLR